MQIIDVDALDGHGPIPVAVSNETNRDRIKSYFKETRDLFDEIELLRAQRDAWKAEAEHQYGLLRVALGGEIDYPISGALDAYASGKYPALKDIYFYKGGQNIGEMQIKPAPAKPFICHKHG